MAAKKEPTAKTLCPSVKAEPIITVVFDRAGGKYSVNSGPWITPKVHGKSLEADAELYAVTRCMASKAAGHTGHCHWYVWNGRAWVDTMNEC
jgi:hypothetical protein